MKGLPTGTALVVAILMVGAACVRRDDEDLFDVLDIVPQSVELGDRVQILGRGFPMGKRARITFKGTRHRPGRRPDTGWSERVRGMVVSTAGEHEVSLSPEGRTGDAVEFMMTDGLLHSFGDDHVTFEGDVIVSFDAAEEGEVRGTLHDVTVDFHPPTARRLATRLGRERIAGKLLKFLGVRASDGSPESGGVRIERIKPGSRAERAGLEERDVLVRFRGQPVLGLADLVPPAGEPSVELEVQRRPRGGTVAIVLDLAGFDRGSIPPELVSAGILLAAAALVLLVFMAPTAGIITWVERRVWGRMQSRIGPNRVGPQGFLQWLADGVKAITKEDIVPRDSDQVLFRLAPYLVFLGVAVTFVIMPFGQSVIAADLDVGILYVVAATAYVTIGLLMGGWASNNKWSMLGGVRSAAQIVSYEIPAALAIAAVAMMTGTLRLQGIVQFQGGWPWQWLLFTSPVTFVLFFLYFTAALAEANRTPFDLPEAESELVAGFSTEYSGMRYLFFFFAEWANVFVLCGLSSALFLGGWQLPGLSPTDLEASTLLQVAGVALFLLKSWILVFVVIWIRATLPRIRIDQLMHMCWKVLVPVSFVLFVLTGLWVLWQKPVWVARVFTGGTLVLGLTLLVVFGWRVIHNYRSSNRGMQAFRLNPFV